MKASLRNTLLASLAAVGLLCVLLFPGALFRGEVLSQADFLLQHEPWRAVAPPGFVPGNAELSDQATQFQPWNLLLRERLAGGALPLWNPRAGAGEPLMANLQSAVFSPYTALAQLFPFGLGLLVAALAQLLVAGAGTALFVRRLGGSLPACVFAALAFSFGGFQFLWLQHPHAAVSSLLPWLLLLADLWLCDDPRRLRVGQGTGEPAIGARADADSRARRAWLRPAFALGVAALLLCGHIETALHVALAVAAWVVLASAGRPLAARAKLIADIGLWSLVGAALAGVQMLPFVEYLQLSEIFAKRDGFQDLWRRVPWEHGMTMGGAALLGVAVVVACRRALRGASAGRVGVLPAVAWGVATVALGALLLHDLGEAGFSPFHRLLFFPDAYGHPVPSRGMPFDGPRSYVNINNGYAGWLTLPLALFALTCGPRGRRGVKALGVLWLGAFLLAYELPIASQLVNRLPLLNLALNYRFTLVVGFCAAVLGGLGLDALCRPATRGRPAAIFWLLAAVLCGAFALAPAAPGTHAAAPRWWALGAAALALMAWGTRVRARSEPGASVPPGAGAGAGAWLGLAAIALLGADLFLFARDVHPSAPAAHIFPPTPVTDFLAAQPPGGRVWAVRRNTLMPNTAGTYGLSDLRDYDALGVERMAQLREALRAPGAAPAGGAPAGGTPADGAPAGGVADTPDADLDVASALFDVLDVRHVLAPAAWTPPSGSRLMRVFASGDCVVWRNERATGRAFVAASARSIDAYLHANDGVELAPPPAFPDMPSAAVRRLRTLGIARAVGFTYRAPAVEGRPLLIEGDAPLASLPAPGAPPRAKPPSDDLGADSAAATSASAGADTAPAAAGSVTWRVDEPEHQELDVSAAAAGWLCVADAFFPGWTASVNGAPATIVPAFFALRAVPVPAGASHVVFRYEPRSVSFGLWTSAAALLVLLGGALAALRAARWSGGRGVAESAPGRGPAASARPSVSAATASTVPSAPTAPTAQGEA